MVDISDLRVEHGTKHAALTYSSGDGQGGGNVTNLHTGLPVRKSKIQLYREAQVWELGDEF